MPMHFAQLLWMDLRNFVMAHLMAAGLFVTVLALYVARLRKPR